jgi:20S proteasome subunit alpha 4
LPLHPGNVLSARPPPSPPKIREFLEKHYAETSGRDTIKLAIRALMETVEASSKNIEIAVMERDSGLRLLADEELDALVAEVEADKAAAEAAKRGGGGGGGGGGAAGPSS